MEKTSFALQPITYLGVEVIVNGALSETNIHVGDITLPAGVARSKDVILRMLSVSQRGNSL